jgi:hypothetical protein
MNSANLLSIFGAVYDIIGAILLAEGLVRTRDEILVRQARHGGKFSGGNLPLFGALEEQRHDAQFGLGLLIGGFLLQLVAAFGYAVAINWLSISLLIVLPVVILIWWHISAKQLSASRRERFADSLGGMDRLNFLAHNPEDAER